MTESPLSVNSTYMDFVTAIEADIFYPIAFQDRKALGAWISENGLNAQSIGRCDKEKSAVLVSGELPFYQNSGRYYSQIWVRAKYKDYRKSVLQHIKYINDSVEMISNYDADHSVSKKRLLDVWPEAWVNLTLVRKSINRSIGSMLEKDTLEIESDGDVVGANLEFILKLLMHREGRLSKKNMQEYFDEIGKRFLHSTSSLDAFLESNNADGFLTDIAMKNNLKNRRPPLMMIVSSSS